MKDDDTIKMMTPQDDDAIKMMMPSNLPKLPPKKLKSSD